MTERNKGFSILFLLFIIGGLWGLMNSISFGSNLESFIGGGVTIMLLSMAVGYIASKLEYKFLTRKTKENLDVLDSSKLDVERPDKPDNLRPFKYALGFAIIFLAVGIPDLIERLMN